MRIEWIPYAEQSRDTRVLGIKRSIALNSAGGISSRVHGAWKSLGDEASRACRLVAENVPFMKRGRILRVSLEGGGRRCHAKMD